MYPFEVFYAFVNRFCRLFGFIMLFWWSAAFTNHT